MVRGVKSYSHEINSKAHIYRSNIINATLIKKKLYSAAVHYSHGKKYEAKNNNFSYHLEALVEITQSHLLLIHQFISEKLFRICRPALSTL